MPYPVFPHTIDHLIVQSPTKNLEIITRMGKDYMLKTCSILRDKSPNYSEFLDWILVREEDIIPYQIQVIMCINVWDESQEGSSKTLKAIFVTPSIQDRVVTRSFYSEYYRSVSHYLAELNKLIKSAYPDVIPLC